MESLKRIAAVIIEDRNHRIFFQLRDNNPNIDCPNQWGLFGGHIEPNETPQEAVVREIFEELRISVDRDRLQFLFEHAELPERITYVFYYRAGVENRNAVLTEGQRLGRMSHGELRSLQDGSVLRSHFVAASAMQILRKWLRINDNS